MSIEINESLVIPDAELHERFTSSGGPGGQHANKAATRVELHWSIVDSAALSDTQRHLLLDAFGPSIRVVVDDERSQLRNRGLAERRLADRVGAALQPRTKRRNTRPTGGSKRRRLDQKRKAGQQKRLRQKPHHDD